MGNEILMDIGNSLGKVAVATVFKLSLGSDDFCWIAPFMAGARFKKKVEYGVKYVTSVVFLTLVACLCGEIVILASGSDEDPLVSQIISTVAGAFLILYGFYMAWDEGYLDKLNCFSSKDEDGPSGYGALDDSEKQEEPEEELGPCQQCCANSITDIVNGIDAVFQFTCGCFLPTYGADEVMTELEIRNSSKIVVVAFLGSIDDFMVYFTLALTGAFQWYELTLGVAIGAAIIATATATLLESSQVISDFVQTVPIPLILLVLGTVIILSAWTTWFDAVKPTPEVGR
ncbi:hypothetical protein M885DRAFT_526352 [Pelagophyceae sp. CCMP2097]|nr:hypothetical protein M885DRAFT_526352 [Pelagophyceae sp. CCMP2097]